tara:strand:+ start:99886 stop:100083 length:198 start_codon:yes stop_codon:yes gene_type:complete
MKQWSLQGLTLGLFLSIFLTSSFSFFNYSDAKIQQDFYLEQIKIRIFEKNLIHLKTFIPNTYEVL